NQFQSVPVVVKEDASVYDAISTMFLGDVGTLFVVNSDNRLSGVLSRKDLLRASLGNQELNSIPVHIIITRMQNITVSYYNDALKEAAKKLSHKMICEVKVVKEKKDDQKIIGRITITNITIVYVELIL